MSIREFLVENWPVFGNSASSQQHHKPIHDAVNQVQMRLHLSKGSLVDFLGNFCVDGDAPWKNDSNGFGNTSTPVHGVT